MSAPPFPNAPLALTVLEIRYPRLGREIEGELENEIRKAIKKRLPLLESMTEQSLQVSLQPASASTINSRTIQRLMNRIRTTALVIRDEALVLETTSYEGWEESFRPLIKDVVDMFSALSPPDGVSRIGLRYIDEIRVPEIDVLPGDWSEYINGHLLAAIDPRFVPGSLQPSGWQGVVQYQTQNDSTLAVRYGPRDGHAVQTDGATRRPNAPAAGPYFLLDSDSFWQAEDEIPEFQAEWILDRCDKLHAPTREFFKMAVTDKLRDEVFQSKRGGTN